MHRLDVVREVIESGRPLDLNLTHRVPVHFTYITAWAEPSGGVQFRPDVYGWDDNIAKALGLAPGPPQRIEQPESSDDIGP